MQMSGFICHDDYLEKTARLSDTELGRVFRALMVYHRNQTEPELNERESMVFDFIKVDIDRTEKKYQEKCDKNREIRLAAIEKNERERSSTNVNERDQYKENKRKEKEKENTKKENVVTVTRFLPPTVEEVALYCAERHNHVNASKFVDYYTANGWKVGKSPMKDWKAAVRTWERSEYTEKDYQYDRDHSGLPY